MINRIVLSALSLACFVFASSSVYAQPVPGCNPQVLDAMQKKAQAKVATDVAMTESITDKPDSVLAMTCFNNAAGTSAVRGGSIFSGDFLTSLQPIIEDALNAFYDDFQDGEGFEAFLLGLVSSVDYTQTVLQDVQDCNEAKDLWNVIKDRGIQQGIPFASLSNLISGAAPAGLVAGDEYNDNWAQNVTDAIFSDLAAAINALPVPQTTVFAPNMTACQILKQGPNPIIPPATPCP